MRVSHLVNEPVLAHWVACGKNELREGSRAVRRAAALCEADAVRERDEYTPSVVCVVESA